ncbi:hypothetical protein A2333_02110 [Candidatus Wolfebacteria bacterium RIFOXYB2_FULL_49_7]|uniref:Uncharacterized protein n=1 Tax=Candidatus Wolfebacteria bacterium RIFOXYB1_FULL_54_12 TaxID=1802559 RepID=A0A1F8DYS8_9BACT|nr:MAG: hypothetical protein A2372_01710 [Candidatus Wolfebacteria bacterium RIFOXYB1_FULL_54_12]OGM93714.1 MAG: hypothetical protein A2333_02110 [Candidatus Wolfebacteria bacterium RIFOXYB2_FULL_49_7]
MAEVETGPASIQEIAEVMYRILTEVVDIKNVANIGKQPPRHMLYITKQIDIPGEYRIDIDFPTERDAVKNKYVARIVIMLDGSGIDLIVGPCGLKPTRFPQTSWHTVKNLARQAVRDFQK